MRLTKKFAEALDGIDLTRSRVGDVLELPRHDAELLLAEDWADAVPDDSGGDPPSDPTEAAPPGRRSTDALREIRLVIEEQSQPECERRRVEDRIREELRDARAKTISGEPA